MNSSTEAVFSSYQEIIVLNVSAYGGLHMAIGESVKSDGPYLETGFFASEEFPKEFRLEIIDNRSGYEFYCSCSKEKFPDKY